MSGIADRIRSLLRRMCFLPARNEPSHPFDVAHGVETSGLLYADRLPTGHAHDPYSEGYYATAPSLFHGAMEQWRAALPPGGEGQRDRGTNGGPGRTPECAPRLDDYTFVDLGCGKGRVVLMASQYPFRAVRGIELNRRLARRARRNLRRWTADSRAACRDVAIERGDVLGAELQQILDGGGPVVLFLFNPFGAEVLAPLLERLAAAARSRTKAAPIDLVYVHPDHDQLVAATPGIELLRYAEIGFSQEDAAADVFGVASDVCSVYRLGGM